MKLSDNETLLIRQIFDEVVHAISCAADPHCDGRDEIHAAMDRASAALDDLIEVNGGLHP